MGEPETGGAPRPRRRRGWGCALAVLAAAAAALPGPTRADLEAGGTVDRSNCAQVADLLPPPVLAWIEKGDLTLTLGEMRDEVAWEAEFQRATAGNAGRYDVDGEGGLIDPALGERPAHTYGFPFPTITPEDPKAGVKVMWNATVTTYKVGRLHTPV